MERKTPRYGGINVADQKRIPEDVKAQAIALAGQGVKPKQIAEQLGLIPGTVSRWLKRNKAGVIAAALNLEVGSKGWRKQELARLYSLVADNPSKRDPLDIIEAFRKEEESDASKPSQAYQDLVKDILAIAANRPKAIEAPYTIIEEAQL